jgi:hypothetical protein
MQTTSLTLARTRLVYETGVLTRKDWQGGTVMSLRADCFGQLRLETRFQGGALGFLLPGLVIAALTARYGDQDWVRVLFYSLAGILLLGGAVAVRGPYIIIPSVGGQDDLAINVLDDFDLAEAFVFSVNQQRGADADLLRDEPRPNQARSISQSG